MGSSPFLGHKVRVIEIAGWKRDWALNEFTSTGLWIAFRVKLPLAWF